jgi:hypothetical protein
MSPKEVKTLVRLPSHPVRILLRFSVRALIVLVLVLGGVLGWIVRSARVQRDAVAAIEKAGGGVWYDWELKDGSPSPNPRPWWSRWLADHVGVDYFSSVVGVAFFQGGSDAEAVHVGRLSRLVDLDLQGPSVTDAGLAHLKGLTSLQVLNLSNTQVTDAGLTHLKRLTSLQVLWLNNTRVGNAGLAQLKGLTNLKALRLVGTRVNDAGATDFRAALTRVWIDR